MTKFMQMNLYVHAKHYNSWKIMFQMNFELNDNEKNEYVEEEKILIMKMKIYI